MEGMLIQEFASIDTHLFRTDFFVKCSILAFLRIRVASRENVTEMLSWRHEKMLPLLAGCQGVYHLVYLSFEFNHLQFRVNGT